jgi:peroxiredoxin
MCASVVTPLTVGSPAPWFSLPSVQGEQVDLAALQGRQRIILWFSRGFQCPLCRSNMSRLGTGYDLLASHDASLVQIAPNLLESALAFFGQETPPFPFVCDPDKRLFAQYGLGDRGVVEATRSTVVSLAHARQVGETVETARAMWLDTGNRSFLRRLHHHLLTAMDQGLFVLDMEGIVRYRALLGPIEPVPEAGELLDLVERLAPRPSARQTGR